MLVGERTATLVGDAFEFGEPSTVEAKGKKSGVVARELRRMVVPRRPRGGQGLVGTFVGRERELDWLQQVSVTDEPRFALVVGEPRARQKRRWYGSCGNACPPRQPSGSAAAFLYGRSVTYSPLADVLRQELGLRVEDPALEGSAGEQILGLTLGLDVAGDLEPRAAVLALPGRMGAPRVGTLGRAARPSLCSRTCASAIQPLIELLAGCCRTRPGLLPDPRDDTDRGVRGCPGRDVDPGAARR